MGHKDISMTMLYAHLAENVKKEAVNMLNGLTSKYLVPPLFLASESLTESRSDVKSCPIVICLAIPAWAPTGAVALAIGIDYENLIDISVFPRSSGVQH